MKPLLAFTILLLSVNLYSQRGKQGNITISSGTVVNEYTVLTSNASSGQTALLVNNSSLNQNSRFSSTLEAGDLIFIYQAQGATLSTAGTQADWGSVTSYNNSGNYEFCEVSSVPNGTTININCGLKNSYSTSGNVQIVRVPRFDTLIVDDLITCDAWDGQKGGIIVIETLGDMTINASGGIDASYNGFRGGIEDYAASGIGTWALALTNSDGGGIKGESIFGYDTDYTAIGGKYGFGAPANGGGGGDNHNSGGGGGGNGSQTSNWLTGVGVPDPAYNNAWILESPPINGLSSSGGGRGGYTFSGSGSNPFVYGPNDYSAWGGDGRRPVGGLGGRPLDYSTGKIFFGGGGGSGDINDAETLGGHGGNSGGIIYIKSYGNIIGNGSITSNGQDGVDAYSTNPPSFDFAGNDGAGGGGAGGTLIIESSQSIDNNITISANGGKGGDQLLSAGFLGPSTINEAEGPGGGGSGGFIRLSNSVSSVNVNGGISGVTNSDGLSQFPPNGATDGGSGDIEISSPLFNITAQNDTICAGNSTTLTATVTGSLPSGTSIIWYDAPLNGNFIGAGTNFTTGNLSNDTTFYIGFCPGNYTIPVSVIMGTSFTYNTSNVVIADENCSQADGSVTGITISGGAQPLQYEWNSVLTTDQDLTNVGAGIYTLVVTDNNGCAANLGTYTIGENTGPIVDTTNINITDDQCNQNVGSITGINVSGISPISYSWNGQSAPGSDLLNIGSGLYDIEVSDAFGCSTIIQNIEVLDNAGPSIDTTSMVLNEDHCGQGIGSISGITVSGASPFIYEWNGTQSLTQDTLSTSAGFYELVVVDSYGCSDTVSNIEIQDVSGPTIDTTSINIIAETCENGNGSISNIIVSGNGPYTYYWNNVSETLDISNLAGGLYDLIVEDSFGCQDTVNDILVDSYGFPTADFTYSPENIYVGDSVTYVDVSSGNITNSTFTLSDGTQINDSIAKELFLDRGVYNICLSVQNVYGCVDSTCLEITVSPALVDIILPNIITPNKDGSNDYFFINGIEGLYSIEIFNRWGNIVYSESPYMNHWDGTNSSGKMLPDGTYYFILKAIGETDYEDMYTGFIELIR